MSDPLAVAKRGLRLLEDQVALHAEAIRYHEADKQKAVAAAEEVRSFIRLYERYSVSDDLVPCPDDPHT